MPAAGFQHPDAYSDTERQIFDAALQEFARKGKDGARMQAIADRADINKAMLHYYFRSKDQLYEQVFGFTMRRFMAAFGESLGAAPTFRETLRVFIDGYVDFIRDNRAVMQLMVSENLAGGSALGRHLRRMQEAERALPPRILVERIEAAVNAGEIRPVDPHHTVLSVISTCLFFFVTEPTVRVIHPAARADWSAFVDARKEHLFDLIYHGLAPRD